MLIFNDKKGHYVDADLAGFCVVPEQRGLGLLSRSCEEEVFDFVEGRAIDLFKSGMSCLIDKSTEVL